MYRLEGIFSSIVGHNRLHMFLHMGIVKVFLTVLDRGDEREQQKTNEGLPGDLFLVRAFLVEIFLVSIFLVKVFLVNVTLRMHTPGVCIRSACECKRMFTSNVGEQVQCSQGATHTSNK
jgi:hypothetical protein